MKHEWDYQTGGKTSVRIHNAPGGNSQWSIGWDDNAGVGQNSTSPYQKQYKDQVQTYQTSYQKNAYEGYYGQVPTENVGYAGSSSKSIDKYANQKNNFGAHQQMQSNYSQQQPSQQQSYGGYGMNSEEKTSVKIHNPPGGKSNFSLAFDEPISYKPPALKQYDMNSNPSFGGNQFSKPSKQQDLYGGSGVTYGQTKQQYNQKASQGYGQFGGGMNQQDDQAFGGRHYQQQSSYDKYSPPRQNYQQNQQQQKGFSPHQDPADQPIFGQRVAAGNNCGPTTEKSSVKLHAPPGGKSSITFF